MRATLVECSDDRATVRLTPSWLARLFGAREVVCELEVDGRWSDGDLRWRYARTRRDLREGAHSALILAALEQQPVARYRARSRCRRRAVV